MPCYHPLPAWRPRTGKAPTFKLREGWTDKKLELPCGRCIGCRMEHARQWAIRLMHESMMHEESYFATLTYDDEHLPSGGSLRPRDIVLFLKKLRRSQRNALRYYQCGEYGENLQRPHHHALLFGLHLPDKRLLPGPPGSHNLFRSDYLDQTWGQGTTTVGHVTFESAAYVASYVTKKRTGPDADLYYGGRLPEYATMSRRPGIGFTWLRKYWRDVYTEDAITMRGGKKMRPPDYYDRAIADGKLHVGRRMLKRIKLRRREYQDENAKTGRQLITSEAVTKSRNATLAKRAMEANR